MHGYLKKINNMFDDSTLPLPHNFYDQAQNIYLQQQHQAPLNSREAGSGSALIYDKERKSYV